MEGNFATELIVATTALISRGQARAEDDPDCQNVVGAPVLEHAVAETAENEE
jgi:hypothetical protein